MNKNLGLTLHNPQQDRLSDEALVSAFVARHADLELLLDDIRAVARGGDAHHTVLIGARGMGKSTMLRRIAIAVKEDDSLREAFMALSFREEQYNVISLDAFWRNCGEALAEWCDENERAKLAEDLDRAVASAAWRDPEASEKAFLAACKEIGKRPLLLLDNLDIVLDNLDEDSAWSLRRVLQAKAGPIVIGAATSYLSQGGDRDAPFYEFFHPHLLEPLTETEVMACLHALAERNGEEGAKVRAVLAQEPERVRTIYALSGGNPRVLTLLYLVLQRSETETIFADLEALLDQVTPYYKHRIEEYQSPQQRAVIDAIALHWDPIGSRAISDTTGIEITTISSHLNRLKKTGFIDEVESSGARSSYQLSERFMNIWYLMRHGTRRTRHRLRWLTLFLVRLFSPEEVRSMAAEIRAGGSATTWPPCYREGVFAAEEEVGRFASPRANVVQEPDLYDLYNRGVRLRELGQLETAITVFDEVVCCFESSQSTGGQEVVARALLNKGYSLRQLGRSEEVIAVYQELADRFASSEDGRMQECVAAALLNMGVMFGELGRSEEAASEYDDLIARFASSKIAGVQALVVHALVNKGVQLGKLGQLEEESAVYDEVVVRFSSSEVTGVQEQVARALLTKGIKLDQVGRLDEAISVYDEVIERFATSDAPATRELVAFARANKGKQGLNTHGDASLVEAAMRNILTILPTNLHAKGNLAWALLFQGKAKEVTQLREELTDLDPEGLALLDTGIELDRENFGLATAHLGGALDHGLEHDSSVYFEDLLWVIRLAVKHDFGERLIEWFEETGNHDKYAPVFAALVAYVRGERFLNDVNPETRASAKTFFDQLTAPDKAKGKKEEKPKRGRKRRK
ncbi:MAG: AAA family ATPase [Kiloniellales bacterium]